MDVLVWNENHTIDEEYLSKLLDYANNETKEWNVECKNDVAQIESYLSSSSPALVVLYCSNDINEMEMILKPFVEQRGGHVLIQSPNLHALTFMMEDSTILYSPQYVAVSNYENKKKYSTWDVSVQQSFTNNIRNVPLRHTGRWIYGPVLFSKEQHQQQTCQEDELALWEWCCPSVKISKWQNESQQYQMTNLLSRCNRKDDIVLHVEVPFCQQTVFGPSIILQQKLPHHLWHPLLEYMDLVKERNPKLKYPPRACRYMHRLYEYGDVQLFFKLSTSQQQLWMSLQDCVHHIDDIHPRDYTTLWAQSSYCTKMTKSNDMEKEIIHGDYPYDKQVLPVCIHDIDSVYHGRFGHIIEFPSHEDKVHHYHVQVWACGPQVLPNKIQKYTSQQLKTLGGISRTNAFESSGLFLDVSRINHSCLPNVQKVPISKYYQYYKQQSETDPTDKEKIQFLTSHPYLKKYRIPQKIQEYWETAHVIIPITSISRNEQLYISYGCHYETNLQFRRDWLQIKYGFICQCPRCTQQEQLEKRKANQS